MLILWLLVALSAVIHWLYKVNNDYYILSFFARRVRTKNGRSVESVVPTPKGRTIFANCFDLMGKDNAEGFQYFRDQAKRCGESYLLHTIGKASFNVIDGQTVENILNHPKLINKGFVYDFLKPFLKTGVLTATEKKWHTRRSMLQRTFHFNILNQFQEIFIAESLKFVDQFKEQESSIVSLSDPIYRFTLNSICETAMGVKLDEMGDAGKHYRDNFHLIDQGFVRRIRNPLYWGDFWYNLFAARDYAAALKKVHDFSSDIIAKRRILLEEELEHRRLNQSADDDIGFTSQKPFAMLDTFICAEKDGLIDHKGICEEVDTLIYEGYDTPFHAIKFGLINMSLYPDHQEDCYQEIQQFIEDDLNNLDPRHFNNLKKLDCFLKETMRLFPSGPILARQVVEETELANGLILPKDSHINIHIFDIHRNPKHWDSPDQFRPERFLTENCQRRHPYAYIPFSAGPRNCLGQKYAMQQIKTLLVVILKHFKIVQITNPQPIVFQMGIQLRTTNILKVKFVRRK